MIHGKLENVNAYLSLGVTDMRKSINGLSLFVEEQFELNLFTGNLFVFCNRRRDMVKILYWDTNVFCVWMKRLEADCFRWPNSEQEVMEVSGSALSWLLHGLDLCQAYRPLLFEKVG